MKNGISLIFIAAWALVGSGPVLAQSSTSTTPKKTRTVCEDVVVQDQPGDKHQIAGMAIGGVAGAAGGAYAGKKIQENQQSKNTHVERRCHEVSD